MGSPAQQSAIDVDEVLKTLSASCGATRGDRAAVEEILRSLKKRAVFVQLLAENKAEDLLRCLQSTVGISENAAKLSIQLAFNLVALDKNNAASVWSAFKARLVDCICSAPEEVALLIHICARSHALSPREPEFSLLFNALKSHLTDDSLLAIESLALLPGAFDTFDSESRIVVNECLNVVHSQCKNHEIDHEVGQLFEIVAKRFEGLVDTFVLSSESRLRSPDETGVRELIAALDLLGTISASDDFRVFVQKPFLVVCATSFLRALHDSQQLSDNPAAESHPLKEPPVEKMEIISEVRSGTPHAGITDSPSFELKQKLLMLIGNLVYRNETAQNLVRESGGLVPLLNSCRMDARNPYLMQWAILAIRNMCEGNVENQRTIESLKNEGLAQTTARTMLDHFGASGDKLEEAVLRIAKH